MNQAGLELLREKTTVERFDIAVDCYATATCLPGVPRLPHAGNGDANAALVLLASIVLAAGVREVSVLGLLTGAARVALDAFGPSLDPAAIELAHRVLSQVLVRGPNANGAEELAAQCGAYLARRGGESVQNGGG